MDENVCNTDEIQEEPVQLTEEERVKFLSRHRIGAIIHLIITAGLLCGLYLYFEKDWFYAIGSYVIGYYLLGLLLRLIPNIGKIFYPGYRETWDGHNFIMVEDSSYSKCYGLIALIKEFVFSVVVVVIVAIAALAIFPKYLDILALLVVLVIILLQTLILPVLNDILAICFRRRFLHISEKIESIIYRSIIALAVVTVIVMQFVYPLYTKSKFDVVDALNQRTPYYTQEFLDSAEVTYDYSHAGTVCEVMYVGKININNMIFDTKTYAKFTFDTVNSFWDSNSTPHHTLQSEITVEKGKPAIFEGEREISIDGFEGEGIVTIELTDVQNGVGNGVLQIHTLNNEKLLYSSNFTIEKAYLNADAAYSAVMEKPLDVGYFSNKTMDIKIDISKHTFEFYEWSFYI